MALKGNQGEFHDDIKLFLDTQLARSFTGVKHDVSDSVDGDHGRIEQRKIWLTTDIDWLIERRPRWQSVKAIAVVESSREIQGDKPYERRYYITSHKDKSAATGAWRISCTGSSTSASTKTVTD